MPVGARAVLIVAAICLGAGMLFVGSGMASQAIAGFGKAIGDAVSRISVQSSSGPRASAVADLNTPSFDQPEHDGYTNQPKVTLSGTVPSAVVGKSGYAVRVYAVQSDGKRLRYQDVAVAGTVRFSVAAVPLAEGKNTFVATLVAPSGESPESQPVTYTLDTTPPKITILSPANKASVTTATVVVTGRTEAGAAVAVSNGPTPGTGDSIAGSDGTFKSTVALVSGDNTLTISATDPAGNTTSVNLVVHRSLGKLAASVTVSPTKLPSHGSVKVTVTVRATASDGSPLANAKVVFSLAVPGLTMIQSPELTTNSMGQASWTTTVQDAWPGTGFATADVRTDQDGSVTGTAPLSVP